MKLRFMLLSTAAHGLEARATNYTFARSASRSAPIFWSPKSCGCGALSGFGGATVADGGADEVTLAVTAGVVSGEAGTECPNCPRRIAQSSDPPVALSSNSASA